MPKKDISAVVIPAEQPATGEQLAFPEEGFARRDDLVPMVNEVKEYQHRGKRLSKDEQLVSAICEALVARGWSERDTAKYYHVSRHTIRAMMDELEKSGKLAPLKQRLSLKLGLLAELSLDASIDVVRRGTVPANVLPIMAGVALDKKDRIDAGNAGNGGQHIHVEVTIGDLEAAYQKLRTVDVKSIVTPSEPSEKQGLLAAGSLPGHPDPEPDQVGRGGSTAAGPEGGDALGSETAEH